MAYSSYPTHAARQRALLHVVASDKERIYNSPKELAQQHRLRIKQELVDAGLNKLGFMYGETRYLPRIIHDDEHIEAAVTGRGRTGRAMLIATDKRAIYLDKKPLFIKADELTYYVVSGVTFSQSILIAKITLHTRMGDYSLRTTNVAAARQFRDFIESRCLEQDYTKKEGNDYLSK